MKHTTPDKIWASQVSALQELECNLKSLEKSARELRSKVEQHKLDNNYSVNEDCLRYAINVWKGCLRLAELKKLQWEVEGKDSNGMTRRKERE